jgi:hypothetical protein
MNKLRQFLSEKRDDLNMLFESHYLLYLTKYKIEHQSDAIQSLNQFKNILINKINTYLDNLNCTNIYSGDLYKCCDEYIAYSIKYRHNRLELSRILDQFTYDLYMFITNMRYILNKLSYEVINFNMGHFVNNMQSNWTLMPINSKHVDKLTLLIEELKILQIRWTKIVEEECREAEHYNTLYEDAINWRKYRHLIPDHISD